MASLDTTNAADLLFGPPSYIAQLLGCTLRSAQRYKANPATLPPMAMKLLQLHYGDLSGVLGPDWTGFYLGKDGKLYAPLFHGGLTALQLAGLFFEHQEVHHLRMEVKKLKAALDHELAKSFAAGAVADLVRVSYARTISGS